MSQSEIKSMNATFVTNTDVLDEDVKELMKKEKVSEKLYLESLELKRFMTIYAHIKDGIGKV